MPPIITISHPSQVEGVLRQIAWQPRGTDLLARVRVYLPTRTENVWNGSEPIYLDLHLTESQQCERIQTQLQDQGVGAEDWQDTVPKSLSGRKPENLDRFLQALRLRPEPEATAGRRELILAYFGTNREEILTALRTVPRDLEGAVELREVAPVSGSGKGVPRYLLRLPEGDRSGKHAFAWERWLVWENRRLGGKSHSQVRLFVRQSFESENQIYIEHGYRHPMRELGLIYPNREQAHSLLIWNEHLEERHRPRWAALVAPQAVSIHYTGSDFCLEMDTTPEMTLGSVKVPETPLPVPWQLTQLSGDRRASLHRLEQRAEGLRRSLHELERERTALLDRDHRRCRWLLRFRQLPNRIEPSDSLRRFLDATWDSQETWSYVFQEDGPDQAGWHILTSRDPLGEHQVPVALADDAFYQPSTWNEYPSLYLRRDCEPSPPLDADQARQLAQYFTAELDQRGLAADGCTLLLEPSSSGIRAIILPLHNPATLEGRLEMLNVNYPQAASEARTSALDSSRMQLENAQQEAVKELARLERVLTDEIEGRLDTLKTHWQEVASRVDQQAQAADQAAERSGLFQLMTEDFAATWDAFVVFVRDATQALVASKLRAFGELDKAFVGWNRMYDDLKKSQENVQDRLKGLERDIARRREQADQCQQRVQAELDQVHDHEKIARTALETASAQTEELARQAQLAGDRIAAESRELASKTEAARTLHTTAQACLKTLTETATGFERMLGSITQTARDAAQTTARLQGLSDQVPNNVAAVTKELERATPLRKTLEAQVQEARQTIGATNAQLEIEEKAAAQLLTQVQQESARVQRRRNELTTLLGNLNREVVHLRDQTAQVEKLEGTIQDRTRDRDSLLKSLREKVEAARIAARGRTDEVTAGIEKLADEADALAQLMQVLGEGERALGGVRGVQRRVHRAAAALGRYQPPEEEFLRELNQDHGEEST